MYVEGAIVEYMCVVCRNTDTLYIYITSADEIIKKIILRHISSHTNLYATIRMEWAKHTPMGIR